MLVLFLQDITQEQKLAMLERTFFHDVNGLVTGILGASDLLQKRGDERTKPLSESLRRMSLRLANEIMLQSKMTNGDSSSALARNAKCHVKTLFRDLSDEFQQSPLLVGRVLDIQEVPLYVEVFTDGGIVVRILKNMVTNALEASQPGETIRVRYDIPDAQGDGGFSVWNRRAIDPDVALRVFQRNFSTKEQLGRGLGTWSMKFFGEQILYGSVSFESSPEEGTTFRLRLPAASRDL